MKLPKFAIALALSATALFAANAELDNLKKKADAGDPTAQLALGVLYTKGGNGAEKNPALALEYIKAAAEQNFAPAQTLLGCAYAEGQILPRDIDSAIRWREAGAKNGTPIDKWALGNAYMFGYLMPKNPQRGMYWITQAAEAGHPEAVMKLAQIYKTQGDAEQSKYWERKFSQIELAAAGKGDVGAMTSVAKQYMSGKGGLGQNKLQGVFWYKKAAELGDRDAMDKVAKMYAKGKFLPKNPKKAQEYFEKLADADNGYCFKISSFYADGSNGFPQDFAMATKWLERGAQRADDSTKLYVAWRYWRGFETPKDLTKAVYWCAKVSENAPQGKEKTPFFGVYKTAERMMKDISDGRPAPENFGQYYNNPPRPVQQN